MSEFDGSRVFHAYGAATNNELWAPTNGNRRITPGGLGLSNDRETWQALSR